MYFKRFIPAHKKISYPHTDYFLTPHNFFNHNLNTNGKEVHVDWGNRLQRSGTEKPVTALSAIYGRTVTYRTIPMVWNDIPNEM